MAPARDDAPTVAVQSRTELRDWLAANHLQDTSVWLVTWKKPSPHYLAYDALISELLCWGWIDSQTRRVDDARTSVRIAPRNPRSAWSAINKSKVEDLRRSGLMTPAGEAAIRAAQDNGMWSFLDVVERLEVPDDLAAELGDLRTVWDDYPRSVRRAALEWIKTAKRAETRGKRITDVVSSALEGKRPSPFRR